MNQIEVASLSLQGLMRVTRMENKDDRGSFSRLFCSDKLSIIGWTKPIVQINITHTQKKGTVRGLHFQRPPFAEMKLISCLKGAIWDVVVDIRQDSETYLQWHCEILNAENQQSLLVPEGFAHGFQALTDNVEMHYCHSEPYNVDFEAGLNAMDPELSIKWPLEITQISTKDSNHPFIKNQILGVKS